MPPRDPHPRGVHTLSHVHGKACVKQWNVVEMGPDHKRHCGFCLALGRVPRSGGVQPPPRKDTPAALWVSPRGEEPKPLPTASRPQPTIGDGGPSHTQSRLARGAS